MCASHSLSPAYFNITRVEYGRSCKDIGCRPSETCVMAQDSCSWNQQDGKECGVYPTCKKSSTATNTSPGKRHLNIVRHAKFDFLIVFVYCIVISFGLRGGKIEQNPITRNCALAPTEIAQSSTTHTHTHINMKNEIKKRNKRNWITLHCTQHIHARTKYIYLSNWGLHASNTHIILFKKFIYIPQRMK